MLKVIEHYSQDSVLDDKSITFFYKINLQECLLDGLCLQFVINIRGNQGLCSFENYMVIGKLTKHKSPVIDQIQTEQIIAWSRTIFSEITNSLILFGIKRICLKTRRSLSLYPFLGKLIKQKLIILEVFYISQLHTVFFNILLSMLSPYSQ